MGVDLDRLRQFFEEGIPFNVNLGIKVEALSPGNVTLKIPFEERLLGDVRRPALHGGVLSALADAAGGLAIWSTLEPGASLSTIDLRIDYLRPGRPLDIWCEAEVLRIGNRVGVSAIRVYQSRVQNVIADARGVYNIRRVDDAKNP